MFVYFYRHNEIIVDIHLNVVVSSELSSLSLSPIVKCKNSTVSANSEPSQSSNIRAKSRPRTNNEEQKMRHRANSDPGRTPKFHENKINSGIKEEFSMTFDP